MNQGKDKKTLRAEIVARPHFELFLNLELVEALKEAALRHYSPECIAAGQVSGFIYGWYNHYKYTPVEDGCDIGPVSATFGQLDIASKCMEAAPRETAALLGEFAMFIRDTVSAALHVKPMWMTGVWERMYYA